MYIKYLFIYSLVYPLFTLLRSYVQLFLYQRHYSHWLNFTLHHFCKFLTIYITSWAHRREIKRMYECGILEFLFVLTKLLNTYIIFHFTHETHSANFYYFFQCVIVFNFVKKYRWMLLVISDYFLKTIINET